MLCVQNKADVLMGMSMPEDLPQCLGHGFWVLCCCGCREVLASWKDR